MTGTRAASTIRPVMATRRRAAGRWSNQAPTFFRASLTGWVVSRYAWVTPRRPCWRTLPGVASWASSAWESMRSSVSAIVSASDLLAQDAGRLEHQHPDQHPEGDHRLPLRSSAGHAEVLHQAQQNPAQHGPSDVADPA